MELSPQLPPLFFNAKDQTELRAARKKKSDDDDDDAVGVAHHIAHTYVYNM